MLFARLPIGSSFTVKDSDETNVKVESTKALRYSKFGAFLGRWNPGPTTEVQVKEMEDAA